MMYVLGVLFPIVSIACGVMVMVSLIDFVRGILLEVDGAHGSHRNGEST